MTTCPPRLCQESQLLVLNFFSISLAKHPFISQNQYVKITCIPLQINRTKEKHGVGRNIVVFDYVISNIWYCYVHINKYMSVVRIMPRILGSTSPAITNITPGLTPNQACTVFVVIRCGVLTNWHLSCLWNSPGRNSSSGVYLFIKLSSRILHIDDNVWSHVLRLMIVSVLRDVNQQLMT